jgi:hypothetical protein
MKNEFRKYLVCVLSYIHLSVRSLYTRIRLETWRIRFVLQSSIKSKLNWKLTSWVTLRAERLPDSQEISLFTEFECSQPCPQKSTPVPDLMETNSSSFWNPMFKVYFNIIILPIYMSLKWSVSFSLPDYRILYLFLSFPISTLYPSCKILLYFITLIWRSIWIMKTLFHQFYLFSWYFVSLRTIYSPQHHVLRASLLQCFSKEKNP